MKSKQWLWISVILLGVCLICSFGFGTVELMAAGHEDGAKNLNPIEAFQGNLAIWTLVTFLIVLAILWKYAWGPIISGLDARENYIHQQRDGAETANAEAQKLLEDYKTQLASAKSEIQAMYDKSQKTNEQTRAMMLEAAKKEVEAVKQQATQEIASAKIQAKKELAAASATLAVEIAGKILQKELTPDAHRTLIDQTVAKFASE
ncbi:MAG: F0F1 ATP synthase subunit B [Planctomycetia bacterium]|nr:F0F1 ATP synthase subunit B [Planctomycetia bacterium]